MKTDYPIKMWIVEPDRHFNDIARKGKQIGPAVDDRRSGGGTVVMAVKTRSGDVIRQIKLTGSDKLKTAPFVIKDAVFPSKMRDYDVIFKATGDEPVLSFVRIPRLD